MKKKIILIIVLILAAVFSTCQAASYTLPEKMYNQLAIGSGLKGTFTINAEGEQFRTPFLNAVTDAEWSIRGISSGKDFHYYIFQTDDQDQQSAFSELYRKDSICYFRSDMVPGKILAFPGVKQYIEALIPSEGENGSSSSFISAILSLSQEEKNNKWEPVLTRYQNELEMWLADFTVKADTVKMDNGFSALDFTYEIPMNKVNERIISLFAEFAADPEVSALLDTIMTSQEKAIYVNGNLLYFYQQALNSLIIDKPVRMNKRVSAMGDLLRFRLELPLDERTTGWQSLDIETIDQLTVYTLKKDNQIIMLAVPPAETVRQTSYEQSVWIANIKTQTEEKDPQNSFSVRIDISKTNEVHEEDEKTHETDHYTIKIQQDVKYLPEDIDISVLPEQSNTEIEANLHYSSKYAQNSATTLDLNIDIRKESSFIKLAGKIKTAAPWLFMPFEVNNPIQVGTDAKKELIPYLTDWISNASSMISYNSDDSGTNPQTQEDTTGNNKQEYGNEERPRNTDEQNPDAETQPME